MAPKLSGKESKMSIRMRIFGRRGSEETYEETDHSASEAEEGVGQSEHPERMSSLGAMTSFGPPPAGLFGPVPYINPRGHKLEARVEVSTLPRNTRGLNSIRGPRAQRSMAPQSPEPDLHNPESQVPEQPATESTTSPPTSPVMATLPSTKTQSVEGRERSRRNREHCQRSRSQKSGRSQKRDTSQKRDRTHPNQVVIPENRGGAGLATDLPDTLPASDGERKKPSANNLSQLDDAILELNDRPTIVQLQELNRDLTAKWKKKPFQVSGLGKFNDIPIDEIDSKSDGESDGVESVGSIDTVGPQTYHLAVEGDVAATPEQPEVSENQLVVRPGDQSEAEPEYDRAQFIYIVATAAAKAECYIEPWVKYLGSYSSGHFVVTNPPKPPPIHDSFAYLPAIKPQDDQGRLNANRMFRPIWESWAAFKPKFTLLVLRILERFDVTGVTVSLFDEEDEIFAVERGLGIGNNFPREHSMAAHALASADPLVVPDTLEDWRFAGHPFVTGPANIRFFAATPLLTHGSQAIAVLSIFDSEPRLMFTPRERREFTGFADRLLTNLSNQVIYMTSAVVRNYPELQHDTWALDELASRPSSPKSERSSVSTPIYPPLQILRKTPTTSPTHSFGSFTSHPPLTSPPQVPLPPLPVSQPGSAASGSFSSRDLGSSYHNHGASTHMVVKPYQHYRAVPDDIVTPDSGNYPAEARPWSSSDLSSIRHSPPNTPKNKLDRGSKLRPFDMTVEDFFELTDEDVQENYSDEDEQEFHGAYDGTYSNEGQSYDYNHEDNRPSYQSSPRVRPASLETDIYDASLLLHASPIPFPEFDPGRMHSSQSSGSIQSAFKLDEETESVAQSVSEDSILSYCSIPLLQRDSSVMRKYKADRKAEKATAQTNLGDDMPSASNRQSVSTASVRSFSSIPLMQRSDAELARKFKGKGKEVDFGDEMPPPKIMATEADQICYDTMRTMEYDLVYAVEIIGARSTMSNGELSQPGAFKLRILASSHAFNLVDDKDSLAHLEALRSRGCFGVPGMLLYFTTLKGHQFGLMAGIHTQPGALRTKTSGIVVAALRRMNTMINGEEENDFMAVVEKLKPLLTTTTKGTFKSRIPRISSTIGR